VGLAKDTIFVFTSDHGEMLGSQGEPCCEKQRPWDESACVPFLLSYPEMTGNQRRIVKTPIDTPDILPTLLALSGIAIPKTIEGEDLSRFIRHPVSDEDRGALIMSVSPFAGYHSGKAYRGIRTMRYTYVRALTGPWLLYDNERDPYQMKNLVGDPASADLVKDLDAKLSAKLKQTGDAFLPGEDYLKMFGYKVNRRGIIGYNGANEVQTPSKPAKPPATDQ